MIGTWINVAAILAGSGLGLLLRRGVRERVSQTILQGLGLCVILIGVMGAIKTQDTMCVIVSMVLGGLAGGALDIEGRLKRLGDFCERKLSRGGAGAGTGGAGAGAGATANSTGAGVNAARPIPTGASFSRGFVTASLVYCVGAMAIVGALDSGIRGDHSTLIAKAALDGVSSVFFASAMGAGVALSALAVLLYQGAIALLGGAVAPLLTDAVIREMGAVGGLLIVGIGLNMTLEKDIRVGNLLPAVFVPLAYVPIAALIG